MFTPFTKTLRSMRRPLSPLGKASVVSLLVLAVLCGLISFFSSALLVITLVIVVSAILVLFRLRWAPAWGSAVGAYVLYVFLIQEAYPMYHLAHPKDALGSPTISFVLFIIMVLIIWWALLAVGAGIGATLQNYLHDNWQRPRWFSAILPAMVGILIGALLIGAVAQPGTASATSSSASSPISGVATVHMGITSFSQSSITITKGSSLLLVDDSAFTHVLSNGSWINGREHQENLAGAPVLNNHMINGGSLTLGPFTTAGTYHIYCSIHAGMMLTIVVQ